MELSRGFTVKGWHWAHGTQTARKAGVGLNTLPTSAGDTMNIGRGLFERRLGCSAHNLNRIQTVPSWAAGVCLSMVNAQNGFYLRLRKQMLYNRNMSHQPNALARQALNHEWIKNKAPRAAAVCPPQLAEILRAGAARFFGSLPPLLTKVMSHQPSPNELKGNDLISLPPPRQRKEKSKQTQKKSDQTSNKREQTIPFRSSLKQRHLDWRCVLWLPIYTQERFPVQATERKAYLRLILVFYRGKQK